MRTHEQLARYARFTGSTLAAEYESPGGDSGQASSLLWELSTAPWRDAVEREFRTLDALGNVHPQALRAAHRWVSNLPAEMPRPSLGAGYDGSLSIEWDRGGNLLHVKFDQEITDVYFSGANGDEFETSLDASNDKIANAMVAIARS